MSYCKLIDLKGMLKEIDKNYDYVSPRQPHVFSKYTRHKQTRDGIIDIARLDKIERSQ